MNHFKRGFLSILPIVSGILPFGAVMGATFADAGLSVWQAGFMNLTLYSGAAQLATVELMKLETATFVVVGTGLIINIRFILYSAALSPYMSTAPTWVKVFSSFTLTDQSYAAMTANIDSFKTNEDAIKFYVGTAVAMLFFWHLATIIGFAFGNIAPASLNLDYAVPLSFVALMIPSLKTNTHKIIALVSSLLSLVLYSMPLRTGLITTALLSIALAWILISRKK
jgi:predicted branched-subunit amino acid permease